MLAFSLSALLYFLIPVGNARADGSPPVDSAASGVVQSALDTAGAVNPADPSGGQAQGSAAAAGPAPSAPAQQAATGQGASANAGAEQQHPKNLVVRIRINSDGDDGPINQSNTAAGLASGSNDATTNQGGAASSAPAGGQQASTGQNASSGATVQQDDAGNVVISIRINSSGNDGAINQGNTAIAISDSGNVSVTNQGVPTGNPSPGGSPSVGSASASPAQAPQSPAAAPQSTADARSAGPPPATATAPARDLRTTVLRAHLGQRTAKAGRSSKAAPHHARRAAGGPAATVTPAVATPAVAAPAAAAPVDQAPAVRQAPSTTVRTPHARHEAASAVARAAKTLAAAPSRALDFLGHLPRRSLTSPDSSSSKNVSSAVVLTLIAVLGALAVFVGAHFLPTATRFLNPRHRRNG